MCSLLLDWLLLIHFYIVLERFNTVVSESKLVLVDFFDTNQLFFEIVEQILFALFFQYLFITFHKFARRRILFAESFNDLLLLFASVDEELHAETEASNITIPTLDLRLQLLAALTT